MGKTSLMSIKRESVKAIFSSVAEGSNISRSEISAKTGLSLMTVGKVVDALLELGVICQEKEKKNSAGRKAGLINLKNDIFMLIIDLTSPDFAISVVDIKLGVIDKMIYSYNPDFYFEENLLIFLKNVKMYVERRFDPDRLIGTGVTLPGKYDAATDTILNSRIFELNNVKIKKIIEEALSVNVTFIEEDIKSAAISNIASLGGNGNGTLSYVYIGSDSVNAVTVVDGEILYGEGGHAGDIKGMLIDGAKNLGSFLPGGSANSSALLRAVAVALFNLSLIIDPAKIIIECDKNKLCEKSLPAVKQMMEEFNAASARTLPELMLSRDGIKHSHRGIAIKLREIWLEKILT